MASVGLRWGSKWPLQHTKKCPKWAMLRGFAHFYPFEHSYVGWLHPQCNPSRILSPCVLLLTSDELHCVGDAHRLRAEQKTRRKTRNFRHFEGFRPFLDHLRHST